MNFLADIYDDDDYRDYMSAPPPLGITALSLLKHTPLNNSIVGDLERALQPLDSTHYRFHFTEGTLNNLSEEGFDFLNLSSKHILKSDWCRKTVRGQRTAILLVLDWSDTFAETRTTDELNRFLESLKTKIRQFQCRVVVLCCYDPSLPAPAAGDVQNAKRTLATFLGDHLDALSVMQSDFKNPGQVQTFRAALSNGVLDYINKTLKQMRDQKVIASRGPSPNKVELVRIRFMMAYLYCLVRETQYASQELLKSLDIILPPNSPLAGPGLSLECRLCASVLLRHYISLRPLEYNSPDYVRVQLYIRWLALPFPANSFASTTQYTLAKVINKLNKVEWLEQLAYTTLGIPNTVKKDLLVSAMYKAMNVVRGCLNGEEETTTTTDTTSFHPSVYLGTECASPAIAAQLLARLKRDAVVKRVENLLESASHLESGGREEEITYFRIALHTPDIREMDSETLFLEKLEQNPVVITAVGQLLRGLRTTTYQAVPYPILLYYLFHGCIQQYDAKERRICVEQELRSLLRQASEKESKLSLEYPRGRFLPPLQALVHFRRRVVEAVADSVDFAVELHTNLPVPTTVKNVKLTFTAAKGEGRERGLCQVGGGDVVVALPDTASFDGAHASCVLLSKVVFTHSGAFYCSSWCATVEMEGAAMEITHHYTAEEVKQTESEQRIMTSSVFPIVQVVSPVSYLTVECDEHVTAVEGETATIRVTLRVGEKALQGGICRAPSEPQLYTLDTTDLPPGVLEGGEEEGLISFRLVDVAPQTATSFDLLVKVLRGGRYRLPLFFRYAVEDSGMQVELVKKLTFSVYPPFSVSYAYMGAVPWREEGVQSLQNDLPNLGDTLFTQDEANVLLPVNETAFRLLQRLGEEVKLFFAVKSGSSHAGTLHVTKGTTLTVVATVHCWASGGLTVWRADTVCNPAVRLLFSSTGTFPLFLEEKESATVLAKMQITETGVINPGFLRVLFSPNRANSQRLFADLCYPPITAEPPRLTARVRFPLTASVREPFPYEIDLTNESGEKGLRGRVELFFREKPDQAGLLVEGSTSVTFELRASGKMTVPVRLRGVTHGEYELPLFEVRDVERDEVVTRHTDTHRVRVLE